MRVELVIKNESVNNLIVVGLSGIYPTIAVIGDLEFLQTSSTGNVTLGSATAALQPSVELYGNLSIYDDNNMVNLYAPLTFVGFGVQNITLGAGVTVSSTNLQINNAAWRVDSNEAIVTLMSDLGLGASVPLTINQGTFNTNVHTLIIANSLTVSGGTLNASGPLAVGGNIALSAGTISSTSSVAVGGSYSQSGGEFMAGGQSMTAASFALSDGTFNAPKDLSVNGTFSQTGGVLNGSYSIYVKSAFTASSGTFNAPAVLYISNTFNIAGSTFNHNYGKVVFYGNTTGYNITTGGASFYNVMFDKDVTSAANVSLNVMDSFTVLGDMTFTNRNLYSNGAGYTLTVVGSGTLNPVITVYGNIDFPYTDAPSNISLGWPLTGILTIRLAGNLTISDSNNEVNLSASMSFIGSGPQYVTIGSGMVFDPTHLEISYGNWSVDSASSMVTLMSDITLTPYSTYYPNLLINQGTFYLNGKTLTMTQPVNIGNSGTLRLQGGENTSGFTVNNIATSGTIEYVGDGVGTNYGSLKLGNSYKNLVINSTTGSTFSPNAGLAISTGGMLKILAGTLDMKGYALNMPAGPNFVNEGTLKLVGSETLTGFTNDLDSGTVEYYGTGTYTNFLPGYYNLKLSGNGTYSPSANIDVNGSFTQTSGTFNAPATMYIGKDFTHSGGTFRNNNNTIILDSPEVSRIYGTTTFGNLTCTTAGKTIMFDASGKQTISGTLTITGAAGNLITIDSTDGASQGEIAPDSSSISYVRVQNSNKQGAVINAVNSVDVDNNTGWSFDTVYKTWTGAVSSAWDNTGNWSGGIPGVNDNVKIVSAVNSPVLSGATQVAYLRIESGQLNLAGNTLTITGDLVNKGTITTSTGNLDMDVAGRLSLAGGTITSALSNGNIDLTGVAQMGLATGGAALTSGTGNVTIGAIINGAQHITVTAGNGDVIFSSFIGNITPVGGLTVNSSRITTVSQKLVSNGPIDINASSATNIDADITVLNTSAISIERAVIGGAKITTAAGNITFDGASSTDTNAVSISTGPGAGNIIFNGALNLGRDLSLEAGTGNVMLNGAVNIADNNLKVTSSATTGISGGVTGTSGDIEIKAQNAINLSSNITLARGNITFNGPVSVTANAPVVSAGSIFSGNILFNSTLALASPLTLEAAAGEVRFAGSVNTGANNLTVISSFNTVVNGITGTTGSVNILAYNETAVNSQIMLTGAGAVTIHSPILLKGVGIQTVGGAITLDGNVTVSVAPITVSTGAGAGDIRFTGDLVLGDNLTLWAGTGNTTFDGKISSVCDLTFTAGTGDITFAGAVGISTAPIGDVTIGGANNVTMMAAFYPASLTANNITGTFSNGGTTTATGAVNISASVIDINYALKSSTSTITLTGLTYLGAGLTTANKDITITGNVILDAATVALDTNTGAGNITITGTVNSDGVSARTISFDAGTGNVTVGGAMGSAYPLNALTITTADTVYFGGNITTDNNFTVTAGTVTFAPARILTIGGAVSIGVNGAVIAGNTTWYVAGNWVTNASGIFQAGTSTIILNGTIAQTITANGTDDNHAFNNMIITNIAGARVNTMRIKGSLEIATGAKLTTNANMQVLVESGYTNNGSLILNAVSSLIDHNGTSYNYYGGTTGITKSALISDFDATDNVIIKVGKLVQNEAGACASLTIDTGTIYEISGTYLIQVSGNWVNNGTFTANNSTVEFVGAGESQILGETTFNKFTCVAPGKHLSFEENKTQTISGTLTITGSSGHLIILRAVDTVPASTLRWKINPLSAMNVSYVDVKDSESLASLPINPPDSIDSGNNIKWFEATYNISGYVCSDREGTAVGSGVSVVLVVSGVNIGTTSTSAAGQYSFITAQGVINDGDPVLVYIDNNVYQGNVVTISSGAGITNMNIYSQTVILRHETADPITNITLSLAKGGLSDTDILYSVSGANLALSSGTGLFIWSNKTYTPGGNFASDDLIIKEGAVYNAAAYITTLTGDLLNSGTLSAGTSTINFAGAGAQLVNLTPGVQNFYNVAVSNNSAVIVAGADAIRVTGTLSVESGSTLAIDSSTNYVFVDNGTLNMQGTIICAPDNYLLEHRGTTYNYYSGMTGLNKSSLISDFDATDNVAIKMGKLVQDQTPVVCGSMTIDTGATYEISGSGLLQVSGNWSNSGTLTANTSTVEFIGTGESQVLGNSTFYDLTCTVPGKTLKFEAGKTQTINNTLTLSGIAGTPLILRSTQDGTQWLIEPLGTKNITCVDVKDSKNITTAYIMPTNSFNSGNTSRWFGLIISGVIYLDKEITETGWIGINPIGPGVKVTLRANIDGETYTIEYQTYTDADSRYTFQDVGADYGEVILVYVDDYDPDNTDTFCAGVLTVSAGTGINDLDLYGNTMIARSESLGPHLTLQNFYTAINHYEEPQSVEHPDGHDNDIPYWIMTDDWISDMYGGPFLVVIHYINGIRPNGSPTDFLLWPNAVFDSTEYNQFFSDLTLSPGSIFNAGSTSNEVQIRMSYNTGIHNLGGTFNSTNCYFVVEGEFPFDNIDYGGHLYQTAGTFNAPDTLKFMGGIEMSGGVFNSGSTLVVSAISSNYTNGDFKLTGGTFNAPAGPDGALEFYFSGQSEAVNDEFIIDLTGGGTFNCSNVKFRGKEGNGVNWNTISVKGLALNNVEFYGSANYGETSTITLLSDLTVLGNMKISAISGTNFNVKNLGTLPAPTIDINGDLIFDYSSSDCQISLGNKYFDGEHQIATLNINLAGDLTIKTFNADLSANINFIGTADQHVSHVSASQVEGIFGTWTVNKPQGAVIQLSDLTSYETIYDMINFRDLSLDIENGTYYTNGYDLFISDQFSNNGTLKLQGGEVLTLIRDIDSGTVEYAGDGSTTDYSTLIYGNDYYKLLIRSTTGDNTFTANGALNIGNNLTIWRGTLDLAGNTLNLPALSDNLIHYGGTLKLIGTEVLNNFVNDTRYYGTVEYYGSNTYSGLIAGNDYAYLRFSGTGTYNLTAPVAANHGLYVDNGTVNTGANNVTVYFGPYVQTGGIFNAPTTVLSANGFVVSPAAASGFHNNNGTVVITSNTHQYAYPSENLTQVSFSPGGATFYDLTFNPQYRDVLVESDCTVQHNLTVDGGSAEADIYQPEGTSPNATITVLGDMIINHRFGGYHWLEDEPIVGLPQLFKLGFVGHVDPWSKFDVKLAGQLILNSGNAELNTNLIFIGDAVQTITNPNNTLLRYGSWTVDKTGGSLNIETDLWFGIQALLHSPSFTLKQGTVNLVDTAGDIRDIYFVSAVQQAGILNGGSGDIMLLSYDHQGGTFNPGPAAMSEKNIGELSKCLFLGYKIGTGTNAVFNGGAKRVDVGAYIQEGGIFNAPQDLRIIASYFDQNGGIFSQASGETSFYVILDPASIDIGGTTLDEAKIETVNAQFANIRFDNAEYILEGLIGPDPDDYRYPTHQAPNTMNLRSNLLVGGNFVIADVYPTHDFDVNARNNTISVAGNWDSSQGIFTADTSTVLFNGAGVQTINTGGLGAGRTFNNLSVNSTSAVDLLSDVRAEGDLHNIAGTLDTNYNDLYIKGDFTIEAGALFINLWNGTKGTLYLVGGTDIEPTYFTDYNNPSGAGYGQNMGHIQVGLSPAKVLMQSDMTYTDLIVASPGNLVTNGYDLEATASSIVIEQGGVLDARNGAGGITRVDLHNGLFSNEGTMLLTGNEVLTGFTMDTDSGTVIYSGDGYYSGLPAGNAYYDLVFDLGASGTYVINTPLVVNNDMVIYNFDGTIIQNAAVNVTGDYLQSSGLFMCDDPSNIGFTVNGAFIISGTGRFDRFYGNGTAADPYQIHNIYDLQAMVNDPWGYYSIVSNIDSIVTTGWNSGAGFKPVGDEARPFAGTLDGADYYITSLHINRPDEDYIGLFGITDGATIKNVALQAGSVTGRSYVGGLVGYNINSVILDSFSKNSVTGLGDYVGGLVGYNLNSTISGSLVGRGINYAIEDTYTSSRVAGNNYVGGLAGYNSHSMIINCYARGDISGSGNIGGLVGYNEWSTIEGSYAKGNINATLLGGANNYVGGLVGYNTNSMINGSEVGDESNPVIIQTYATGNVRGNDYVGGLIGYNEYSTVMNSYAKGNVYGYDYVGGLIGRNVYGLVQNCFATGNVSGHDYVGGLIGENFYGSIVNSTATGNATGNLYVDDYIGRDIQ